MKAVKGSKSACGAMKGFSRIVAVRPLTIFFIMVFVCSVQVASFHHHNSVIVQRDCPICKFLAVFPSDTEAAVQPVIAPDFVHLFSAPENLLIFFTMLAVVPGTRAPPYSFFPGKTPQLFQNEQLPAKLLLLCKTFANKKGE
jgi:hypothetical protein